MPDFSEILFVTDYDRTLTGVNGRIPEENRAAIEYFMAHGGKMTLCTGRSMPLFRQMAPQIPMNAPALLSNGGLCYDFAGDRQIFCIPMEVDARAMARDLMQTFPGSMVEVQEIDRHYLVGENENLAAFCASCGAELQSITLEQLPERVMKLALYQDFSTPDVRNLYVITPEGEALFRGMQQYILERYGTWVSAVRSAPRIVDIQAVQATKGLAARRLARELGRPILVAAGDSQNDITMLDEADYAFVPADGSIDARGYMTVRPCSAGSIAHAVEYLARIF